jgi:hypothetical protein
MDETMKEDHPTNTAQPRSRDTQGIDADGLELGFTHAIDEFHRQHGIRAILGMNAWEVNVGIVGKRGSEASVVLGLAGEMSLFFDRGAEVAHRIFERDETHRGHQPLQHTRQEEKDGSVEADFLEDLGATDFDRNALACGPQSSDVHLGHRCSRERLFIELHEELLERPAEVAFDGVAHRGKGERRHLILQARQLVDQGPRQEIRTRRSDLSNFDEGRAERVASCNDRPTEGAQ